jgi:glycosyltransferase involved in cell wall biosynthesis
MSNVLVLGVGPLPVDESERLYAPGLRTWHFAEVLASHRHRVLVALINFGDFGASGQSAGNLPRREEAGENITIVRLKYDPVRTPEALATLHQGARFDAIVATTDIMNHAAAGMRLPLPMWLDYNGDPFAEKQLQAAVHGSNAALLDQWRLLLPALLRGDRFSTDSDSQKNALIGQLAFAGRLNQHTAGEELVHTIIPCSRAMMIHGIGAPYSVKSRLIPAQAFMAFWSGGYNTWADVDTLYAGVTAAMDRIPDMAYVSTGGGIAGHNTATFDRFSAMIAGGPHAHRFHFLGWVPTGNMPSLYRQADAAINMDIFSYEGELGHRNRIIDWILFGTPVVTTVLCDLTRRLAERRLIWPVEIGNAQQLADTLVHIASHRDEARQRARDAKEYLNHALSEPRIFAPLLEWAASPCFAGDHRGAATAPEPPPGSLPRLHDDLLGGRLPVAGAAKHSSLLRRAIQRVFGRTRR